MPTRSMAVGRPIGKKILRKISRYGTFRNSCSPDTMYEFERLFDGKPVEHMTTAAMDGPLEAIEKRPDFSVSEKDFDSLAAWHLAFAEKRELLGGSNHLLYICRKM